MYMLSALPYGFTACTCCPRYGFYCMYMLSASRLDCTHKLVCFWVRVVAVTSVVCTSDHTCCFTSSTCRCVAPFILVLWRRLELGGMRWSAMLSNVLERCCC